MNFKKKCDLRAAKARTRQTIKTWHPNPRSKSGQRQVRSVRNDRRRCDDLGVAWTGAGPGAQVVRGVRRPT